MDPILGTNRSLEKAAGQDELPEQEAWRFGSFVSAHG